MSEFVEPLGPRILIRKDEARQTTKGGIVLPDQAEIPGWIVRFPLLANAQPILPTKGFKGHPANLSMSAVQ